MTAVAEEITINLLENDTNLTPRQIVEELDRYIIAQEEAKKAVAIALRNRWRRLRVEGELRDEIMPKNIIMIGPTGVGKTEISRRLARLAGAPFIKVEASKFTEIGYVGRDVESIIRDLMEASYTMVKEEEKKKVIVKAEKLTEEKILDLLLPGSNENLREENVTSINGEKIIQQDTESAGNFATREKLRELLRAGKLEERVLDIETTKQLHTHMQVLGPQGFGEIEGQIKDLFSNMVPKQKETKKLPIKEARKILLQEAQDNLVDYDEVAEIARRRAEHTGIVFIDEIDKICGGGPNTKGPDVSREGVQRDLLPLVEGSIVSTKYGPVKTDHILFIASGAFHISKPSDLMPEFQGRFPIRVELRSLQPKDFVRILTEPKNALIAQYRELLKTEGVDLNFSAGAIEEIAKLTAEVNTETENIGARRLHTLLEKLLEDLSFSANEKRGTSVKIDTAYVREKLSGIVSDSDLSRFIL
jgi:ATP-dependent HslUV protease ATP-binding subunit HslU